MFRVFALTLVILLLPATLASQDGTSYSFEYDNAGNMISKRAVRDGFETVTQMPPDSSGRNRPGALGDIPLSWDRNGNLTEKGSLRLKYDFRNLLTVVEDEAGNELVRYVYDAFKRRQRQIVGADVIETTWAEWRPIEIHRNGLLHSRRVYGARLDEVVVLERDTTGDGVIDTAYYPIYDHTGNVALVTNDVGTPIERYDYSPFGTRQITVDATHPVIEQVRIRGSEVWIEVSEAVSSSAVAEAADTEKILLRNTETDTLHVISAAQPVVEGRQRGRRIVLQFDGTPPAPGDPLELRVEPAAIVDFFLNTLSDPFQINFTWEATDDVLHDSRPPIVDAIDVRNQVLEIEFNEPIDLATAKPSIQVAGHVCDWTVDATGYRVIAAAPFPPGLHDIVITTTLLDLAGTPLATTFTRQVLVEEGESFLAWYRRPDPRVTSSSTISNELGFHGLPHDPVTGFVYMRNRYYDPEMARFITPDPLGYVDGPSMYQGFGNSPLNYGDPLGLSCMGIGDPQKKCSEELWYRESGGITDSYNEAAQRLADPSSPWYTAAANGIKQVVLTPFMLTEQIALGIYNFPHDVAVDWELEAAAYRRRAELIDQGVGLFEATSQADVEVFGEVRVHGPAIAMAPVGPGRVLKSFGRGDRLLRVVPNRPSHLRDGVPTSGAFKGKEVSTFSTADGATPEMVLEALNPPPGSRVVAVPRSQFDELGVGVKKTRGQTGNPVLDDAHYDLLDVNRSKAKKLATVCETVGGC